MEDPPTLSITAKAGEKRFDINNISRVAQKLDGLHVYVNRVSVYSFAKYTLHPQKHVTIVAWSSPDVRKLALKMQSRSCAKNDSFFSLTTYQIPASPTRTSSSLWVTEWPCTTTTGTGHSARSERPASLAQHQRCLVQDRSKPGPLRGRKPGPLRGRTPGPMRGSKPGALRGRPQGPMRWTKTGCSH